LSATKGVVVKAARVVAVVVMMSIPVGFSGEGLAKPRVGACPTSEWILDAAPTEDVPGVESTDLNGDGLSCYLEKPEGGGVFTIIDNFVVRP
jgi:hypothetical protein